MASKTSQDMRNDPLFMRNGFKTAGKWEMPLIHKQDILLDNVTLTAYSETCSNASEKQKKCGVHFFIDDYRFNGIYNNPYRSLRKLSQYAFLLSPDNSAYMEMNLWRQFESVAQSRWVGAFWQDNGLYVIPTVTWSDPRSYQFCFDGIERGAIVAVGMPGCKHNKIGYLRGYNAMLDKIEPSAILCLGVPFEEMKGNIICAGYHPFRKAIG